MMLTLRCTTLFNHFKLHLVDCLLVLNQLLDVVGEDGLSRNRSFESLQLLLVSNFVQQVYVGLWLLSFH